MQRGMWPLVFFFFLCLMFPKRNGDLNETKSNVKYPIVELALLVMFTVHLLS